MKVLRPGNRTENGSGPTGHPFYFTARCANPATPAGITERAVITAEPVRVVTMEAEARMRRQEALYDREKTFRFVAWEAGLHHSPCPADVMVQQLDRLYNLGPACRSTPRRALTAARSTPHLVEAAEIVASARADPRTHQRAAPRAETSGFLEVIGHRGRARQWDKSDVDAWFAQRKPARLQEHRPPKLDPDAPVRSNGRGKRKARPVQDSQCR